MKASLATRSLVCLCRMNASFATISIIMSCVWLNLVASETVALLQTFGRILDAPTVHSTLDHPEVADNNHDFQPFLCESVCQIKHACMSTCCTAHILSGRLRNQLLVYAHCIHCQLCFWPKRLLVQLNILLVLISGCAANRLKTSALFLTFVPCRLAMQCFVVASQSVCMSQKRGKCQIQPKVKAAFHKQPSASLVFKILLRFT